MWTDEISVLYELMDTNKGGDYDRKIILSLDSMVTISYDVQAVFYKKLADLLHDEEVMNSEGVDASILGDELKATKFMAAKCFEGQNQSQQVDQGRQQLQISAFD